MYTDAKRCGGDQDWAHFRSIQRRCSHEGCCEGSGASARRAADVYKYADVNFERGAVCVPAFYDFCPWLRGPQVHHDSDLTRNEMHLTKLVPNFVTRCVDCKNSCAQNRFCLPEWPGLARLAKEQTVKATQATR